MELKKIKTAKIILNLQTKKGWLKKAVPFFVFWETDNKDSWQYCATKRRTFIDCKGGSFSDSQRLYCETK